MQKRPANQRAFRIFRRGETVPATTITALTATRHPQITTHIPIVPSHCRTYCPFAYPTPPPLFLLFFAPVFHITFARKTHISTGQLSHSRKDGRFFYLRKDAIWRIPEPPHRSSPQLPKPIRQRQKCSEKPSPRHDCVSASPRPSSTAPSTRGSRCSGRSAEP